MNGDAAITDDSLPSETAIDKVFCVFCADSGRSRVGPSGEKIYNWPKGSYYLTINSGLFVGLSHRGG